MAVAGLIGLGATKIIGAPAAPSFSVNPPGGVFTSNVTAVLVATNGEVRFTLDGSLPRTNSPLYTAPLLVTNSCLLHAQAFAAGQPTGSVVAATFTLLETNLADFNSSLPLVVIQTFGQAILPETNVLASLRCIDGDAGRRAAPGGPPQFEGRAAVKVRGYTSRRYPKKSYAVELVDAGGDAAPAPILGLPKDADWILYAPYPDKSLLRDVLAYTLSNEMGHYASRTRFVEVFLNDSTGRLARAHYAGVYVLEEKIKRAEHRVNVHKLGPDDTAEPAITGGYIFKKDHLEEVDHDGPPAAGPAGAAASRPGRVGYPTGPGGFPADSAGFLPPRENIVTLESIVTTTNVLLVTNIVAVTNILPVVSIAAATSVITVTNVTPLTNILTATNVLITRDVRVVTNVVTLTHAAPVTNIVSITNVAPFPEVARFTNVAVFTNLVTFTNVASVTNAVAVTNLVSVTNLAAVVHVTAITNVAAMTNTAQNMTVELTASLTWATNVTAITNFLSVTNPIVAVTNAPAATNAPPSVLTRLVEQSQGFVTSRTNAFFYVEPKAARITPAQRAWLSNHVNRFEQALHGPDFRHPTNGYAAFIEPGSFIDHHLIVEATKNIDGFRFSTFYVKDRGGRIKMEPIWDWNLTLGNARGRQGDLHEHWYWPQLDDRQYSWFRRLFDDPDFGQRYVDRWAELRAGLFATSNWWGRVDAMAAALKEPAARNFERWPILGQAVATEPFVAKTYDEEILYLKTWSSNRLAWMQAQFIPPPRLYPVEPEVAAGTTLVLTSAVGRVYFTLDGTDPRLVGGAVSSTARTCDPPLTVTNELRIFARAHQDQRWSSPLRARVSARPSQTSSR